MITRKPDSPLARHVLTGLAIAALLIMPVTAAFIDPIGNYAVGDNVTISGSTNIAVNDHVWVKVSASDFHPTSKYESIEQVSGEPKASGTVRVTKGPGLNGKNIWSINFPTKGWETGDYTIRAADASGGNTLLWASATFKLTSAPPTTVSTPHSLDSPSPATTQTPISLILPLLGTAIMGIFFASKKRVE
ncbi:MAG: hypothetical protein WC391_09075 [Methanoregula sp.]|jgi:hypothetical protein